MAITKIHAIKATITRAINYICDPKKTDEGILISSFGCSPETATFDFKFALSKTDLADPNKAFHLIQAFMPGEVSYEKAHQIGIELADKLLEGKYSYIVSTHIDKKHVHNHIIFCAADNIHHKKYHDCKKTYYHIRHLNDEVCAKHQLSIISPNQHGKQYKEWLSKNNNTSWKYNLKKCIDKVIQFSNTYEDFIILLRANGYEIKGETFEENSSKYILFRPLDQEHFIRGSMKSLGMEYTKERIKERIESKNDKLQLNKHVSLLAKKKTLIKEYSSKKLINTSSEKYIQNPALKHWANIENLKIATNNYNAVNSIVELKKQLATQTALIKTVQNNLVKTEHQLKDLGEILKYAQQYKENHIYHIRYQKSKNPDAYLRQHEMQLLLYDGAENILKSCGINPTTLDIDKLYNHYNILHVKKETLLQTYQSTTKELNTLNQKLNNLNQYLNQNDVQQIPDKKIQKDTPML